MKGLIWPVTALFAVALMATAGILGITITAHTDRQAELVHLQNQAFAKGETAAKQELRSGGIVFLSAAHGWGLDSVPGFEERSRAICIIRHMHARRYREYTDVVMPESEEQRQHDLKFAPQKTYYYAVGFNMVMVSEAMNRGIRTCF